MSTRAKSQSHSRQLMLAAEIAETHASSRVASAKKSYKNNGTLYYGDNLSVLREHIKDETVDLVYLDPPFNSDSTYNVLFENPKGHESGAQITAFDDTWHWGEQAESEFGEILGHSNTQVAEVMRALRQFLGENDMMAYLVMMANRLLELHRALKSTGSLYLHCDPTASHYIRVLLDATFGPDNFRNEIVWKRRYGNFSTVHESTKFGACNDSILFYAKSDETQFHPQYSFADPDYMAYVEKTFRFVDATGRKYGTDNLANPAPRPNLMYDYKGYKHPKNGWAISREKMEKWDKEGRLAFPSNPDGRIRRKRFLDELRGKPIQSLWDDIEMLSSHSAERLGYQTQKPLALLERIVSASSNEGDLVLDPFCGCGTAVHAAQKLKRNWIGIDITHLAISLVEKRLHDAFPSIHYEVHGTPKDFEGAEDLATRDKYQFQWWACSLVNAQPYGGKKKGADGGVDGLIFFQDDKSLPKKIIVSVKGGENVGVGMVKDLIATMSRQKAEIGLFVTLTAPTKPMLTEAASAGFYKSPFGAAFPKVQILEVEKLITGSQAPRYPRLDAGSLTFKKAAIEIEIQKQADLFAAPVTKIQGNIGNAQRKPPKRAKRSVTGLSKREGRRS
jgi:site-specific DNA-methyltransferase (adenine-specific)